MAWDKLPPLSGPQFLHLEKEEIELDDERSSGSRVEGAPGPTGWMRSDGVPDLQMVNRCWPPFWAGGRQRFMHPTPTHPYPGHSVTLRDTVHGNFLLVLLAQPGNIVVFPSSSGNFHFSLTADGRHNALELKQRAWQWWERQATGLQHGSRHPPSKIIYEARRLPCAGPYSRRQGHRTGQTRSLPTGNLSPTREEDSDADCE